TAAPATAGIQIGHPANPTASNPRITTTSTAPTNRRQSTFATPGTMASSALTTGSAASCDRKSHRNMTNVVARATVLGNHITATNSTNCRSSRLTNNRLVRLLTGRISEPMLATNAQA